MTYLSNESVSTTDTNEELGSHLIPLAQTEWMLWRSASLRGTGFPIQLIEKLAATNVAAAADQLLDIEEKVQQTREATLDALRCEIESDSTNDERRSSLIKILQQIKKQQLPKTQLIRRADIVALHDLCSISTASDHALTTFRSLFQRERDGVSEAVVSIAQDARFREAVLWQNRRAIHGGIASLLRHAKQKQARNSNYRRHELLIANYVQRYCVKNDSIGFFGPIGWSKFDSGCETIVLHPGTDLLSSRTVYFESWGIHKIAQHLTQDPAMLPWMSPRRLPHLAVEENTLYAPSQAPRQIAPVLAQVLHMCDGYRTAYDIAKHLLEIPKTPFKNAQHIYLLLAQLQHKMGLIEWGITIPIYPHAVGVLRHAITQVEDDTLRTSLLITLDELEGHRQAIAAAVGNPEELDQAIEQLEIHFSHLTNQEATRDGGHMFAARTLIYEDCRRDVELTLGADIMQTLGPPLHLLLISARWFSFEVMQLLREQLTTLYQELVGVTGAAVVDGPTFWGHIQTLLQVAAQDETHPITEILERFQRYWADILAVPDGVCSVAYTSEQLQPYVEKRFQAPYPGWCLARYHSPDIMIAASSVEAIQQGDYQLVLGELHMGTISINATFFAEQHPDSQKLQHMVVTDIPQPRVVPVAPHDWPGVTTRSSTAFCAPKDFHLVWSPDVWTDPSTQVLPIGDLVIVKGADGLEAQTRDGRLRFDIMDLMDLMLATSLNSWFTIFNVANYRHIPRITVDKLIVHRETWICDPESMDFVYEKDETQRFIQARRWMRQMKLPRYVFVKSPVEPKPFYVDFASPVYIELLVKTVRRAQQASTANRMVISEMMPDPSQSWLTDADNQQYTCELRCVVVDSRQYPSLWGRQHAS
ncbi:MAG: lantibiotic dehydratase [Chloroflexota bacterium]